MPRFQRRQDSNQLHPYRLNHQNFPQHTTILLSPFILLFSSIHSQRKKIKEKSKWPCKCRPLFTLQDYHLLLLLPSDHFPIHLLSRHLSSLVPLTFYFILINCKLLMDLPGLPCVQLPNKLISVVTAGYFPFLCFLDHSLFFSIYECNIYLIIWFC